MIETIYNPEKRFVTDLFFYLLHAIIPNSQEWKPAKIKIIGDFETTVFDTIDKWPSLPETLTKLQADFSSLPEPFKIKKQKPLREKGR